jgi:hypothetical protein
MFCAAASLMSVPAPDAVPALTIAANRLASWRSRRGDNEWGDGS